MENTILDLEKNLFKYEYISKKEWLDKVIHECFTECGKSGYLYKKEDTIESLLTCNEDRNIVIYNYTCKQIDEHTWLVHYITTTDETNLIYRTSIWVKEDNLKLIFHQATKYNENITLERF